MRRLFIFFCTISLCLSSCYAQEQEYTNALINETSPYLLQHAHNPVDWHPWNEASLNKAKEEDKLILISIGYAACHWCHVMEHESFEDTTVANKMNAYFLNIKVDREERPDVDAIYMNACQLASGGNCGWPLNVFALPDGRPVWAGTYFPKKNWIEILEYFNKVKKDSPEKLEDYAAKLLEGIQALDNITSTDSELKLDIEAADLAMTSLVDMMDPKWGGRIGAPKFPVPVNQELLLQSYYYTGNEAALDRLNTTLTNIAWGGIYDHLGGGFARYATDEAWRIPHFEKMLYDNAQLLSLYAKAFAITKNELYQQRIEETIAFLEKDLMSAEGGFFSSLDADSEGEEGKYYVWTKAEMQAIIGNSEMATHFLDFYQIKEKGNWEESKNILYQLRPLRAYAEQNNLAIEALEKGFKTFKSQLLVERKKRVAPPLDDKILTAWNALMISGLTDAYRYLGDQHYLDLAIQNANFIREKLQKEDGRLLRTHKDGTSKINAFLDDYAFLAQAFIDLYEVSFDETWLSAAQQLIDYAIMHFYEENKSIFYYTSDLDPPLITRKVELVDNVIPGSNSAMAKVLFDLSLLLYNKDYQAIAEGMLVQMQDQLLEENTASYYANWWQLYLSMSKPPFEIAIVGEAYQDLKTSFQKQYLPNALFLGGQSEGSLALLQNKLQEGSTYIYVCKDKLCKLPVQKVADALQQMKE